MLNNELNEELISLKEKLEANETALEARIKNIENREFKRQKLRKDCDKIAYLQQNPSDIIRLNIGGEIFATSKDTLFQCRGSIFEKDLNNLINSTANINNEKIELFYDRNNKTFALIMDFLRTGSVNYKSLTPSELSSLRDEAEFFEISLITNRLGNRFRDIKFVSFESSTLYSLDGNSISTNNINDLMSLNDSKGIALDKNGYIIITLNSDFDLLSLEFKGLNKKSDWHPENGSGSIVSLSLNKKEWTDVGKIPYGFGNKISKIKLNQTITSKYIKIENKHGYLGLSYLKLEKAKDDLKFEEDK